MRKARESNVGVLDAPIAETLTETEVKELETLGKTQAEEKPPVHIGPESAESIEASLETCKGTSQALKDRKVVEGIMNLVRSDVQHVAVNLRVIGNFAAQTLQLKGQDFDDILSEFYADPSAMLPEVQFETNADGQKVERKNTPLQRLAHAFYHEWPELFTAGAKNGQSLAVRRLSGAIDRHADEVKLEAAKKAEAQAEAFKLLNPELGEDTGEAARLEKMLAAEREKTKSALPKSMHSGFVALYKAFGVKIEGLSDDENARITSNNRDQLQRAMKYIGFTVEVLAKWRAEANEQTMK